MKGKLKIKVLDLILIILSAALTGFSVFNLYVNPQNNLQVMIEGQSDKWIYPLGAEETVPVNGPLGITVIRIHGNEAWVESSPCKNQICVAAGVLHRYGDFAACLPNQVLLAIEGYDDNREIDSSAW